MEDVGSLPARRQRGEGRLQLGRPGEPGRELVGQLLDYPVNHYETTDGQHARYPAYFERRRLEGIPD